MLFVTLNIDDIIKFKLNVNIILLIIFLFTRYYRHALCAHYLAFCFLFLLYIGLDA